MLSRWEKQLQLSVGNLNLAFYPGRPGKESGKRGNISNTMRDLVWDFSSRN
jgi:hypothetical protein